MTSQNSGKNDWDITDFALRALTVTWILIVLGYLAKSCMTDFGRV